MLNAKLSKIHRNLVVKRSNAGLGLFTLEHIKKNDFVVEYTGQIFTRKEANAQGGKYLFETSKDRFIDGSGRNNLARYINHACKPNCEIEVRRGHVLVLAKRNIEAGEELNYDYDTEYFEEYIKPHGCRCVSCTYNN